jgi:transcription elongation GreA/GreB family factor
MRFAFRLRQSKTGSVAFTKVFAPVKKSTLRDAILQQLRQELARQTTAAELARDEAISEESRAQNKWDTHSQEAAYLAEGQARLAAEIGASIELYATLPLPDFGPTDVIALGALVELEPPRGAKSSWYFIGPRAGGLELRLDGREILVLTPLSPLGRQLIGRHVGDVVQSAARGGSTQQRILSVT